MEEKESKSEDQKVTRKTRKTDTKDDPGLWDLKSGDEIKKQTLFILNLRVRSTHTLKRQQPERARPFLSSLHETLTFISVLSDTVDSCRRHLVLLVVVLACMHGAGNILQAPSPQMRLRQISRHSC
jgi:hypothetical protein